MAITEQSQGVIYVLQSRFTLPFSFFGIFFFSLPFSFFPPRQLFACLFLSRLPHYLRAWNRLRHSFRHNHSKMSALRVFCQRYDLIVFRREGELKEAKVKSAEKFICKTTKLTDLNRLIMCALFSPQRSGNLRPGSHLETGD